MCKLSDFQLYLWLVALLISLSSSNFGYNLAILNLPANNIKAFLSETILNENYNETIQNRKFINPTAIYSFLNAILVIFGAFGACIGGALSDRIGRKLTLILSNFLGVIASTLCAVCVIAKSGVLLFIGRALCGIIVGITNNVVPSYLSEISCVDERGQICTLHQLLITFGILLGNVFTLRQLLNRPYIWPLGHCYITFTSIISVLCLPSVPESPRYLYLQKKDEQAARTAFLKFSSGRNADTFIAELEKEKETTVEEKKFKFWHLFTKKQYLLPTILTGLMQLQQQGSGINIVMSYSLITLRSAGVPMSYDEYLVLIISLVNVIVTVLSLKLVSCVGHRPLLIFPSVSITISLLLLTITVKLSNASGDGAARTGWGMASFILMLIFVISFGLSLGIFPSITPPVLFCQASRAAALSFGQGTQLFFTFIVVLFFPIMMEKIGGYSFLPMCCIMVFCVVVLILYLPETRGRAVDDIANELSEFKTIFARRSKPAKKSTIPAYELDGGN